MREVPALDRLARHYVQSGVVVLGVSAWNEPEAKVRKFAESEELSYPILLNGNALARQYGVRGIPTTVYIDPQGRIAGRDIGLQSEAQIEAKVKEIAPGPSH